MKRHLLYLIIFLITSSAYAQQATWNITSGTNYNWVYDFSTGTGNAGSTFTTASSNSISTPTTPGFLPQPISGSARVGIGSGGTPSFTLMKNGATNLDSLQFQASSTGTIGKFSLYGVDGATALTAYYFTARFLNNTATRADWVLAISSGSTSAISSSGVASTGTTSNTDIFGVLRFSVNTTDNTKMDLLYRIKPDAGSTISLNTTPTQFNRGTNYAFEILCNNTSTSQDYTRDGTSYTVPSRTYHIWANGVRVLKTASTPSVSTDYDFPANQLAADSPLNSIFITGNNSQTSGSASNDGTLILSKISMKLANSTLPVSLTQFTGKNELGKVRLKWQTASESNNSHFEILRSSDQNNTPTVIGKVNGKGNSNTTINYDFLDNNPVKGNNYYQLRQVDFDYKSTLSNTIIVKSNLSETDFIVYKGNNNGVFASINSEENVDASFTLIDLNGKVINQFNKRLVRGSNAIEVYPSALSQGIYLVKLSLNGSQAIKKISY
ncbi:T9SS type A sorting domain-containing protein [Pedobacter glucosidilyticus]|uniref:T9SS type A sorting domain-containing protein n=1 Tax=Pedobacter glucosidilyticus TaxID=1122941 RepID=UPI000413BAE0|nr:T9SS type A sorting domain-containing protein [Pedobacter glucosidilyticus]